MLLCESTPEFQPVLPGVGHALPPPQRGRSLQAPLAGHQRRLKEPHLQLLPEPHLRAIRTKGQEALRERETLTATRT